MRDIFIIHAATDWAAALNLARELEAAGYTTWYSERDSLPGGSYSAQGSEEIKHARAVVLLISRRSIDSNEVSAEIFEAYEQEKPFLPILVDLAQGEFQELNPNWRTCLQATATIELPAAGVSAIIDRVISGLNALGITPGLPAREHKPVSSPAIAEVAPSGPPSPPARNCRCSRRIVVAASLIVLLVLISIAAISRRRGLTPNTPPPHVHETRGDFLFTFPIFFDKDFAYNHFYPSGWMADWRNLTFADTCREDPYSGSTCIKIIYAPRNNPGEGWAGIYWQEPEGNWGEEPGGFDLAGAQRLSFVARGTTGDEKLEIRFAGLGGSQSSDSVQPAITENILLKRDWEYYAINLAGRNLGQIIGGFCVVFNAAQNPEGCTIYLDDIQLQGPLEHRALAARRINFALPSSGGAPEPTARGCIIMPPKTAALSGRLFLNGLHGGSSYLMSISGTINGISYDELNLARIRVGQPSEKPTATNTFTTDKSGAIIADLRLELPLGKHDLQLLVKRSDDNETVLVCDLPSFEVGK